MGAAYQVGIPNNVVPRARLLLGGTGQHQFVALAEVMKSIVISTFSLSAHSWQSLVKRIVGTGDPMVPKADGELPCRMRAANERHPDRGGRDRRLQQGAPC